MMRIIYLILFCILPTIASGDEFVPQIRWKNGLAQNQPQNQTNTNDAANKAEESKDESDYDVIMQDSDNESDVIIQNIEDSISIEDIVEPPVGYRYSSFYKRDPFSYPTREDVDEEIIVNKLQLYDVSSLDVVGIWWLASGIAKALILTPPGEGIVVTIGDYVGNNNGEVINITDNKVVIREYQMSVDGTRQFSDIEMPLDESFDSGHGANLKEKSSASNESIADDLKRTIEKIISNPSDATQQSAPAVPAFNQVPPPTGVKPQSPIGSDKK